MLSNNQIVSLVVRVILCMPFFVQANEGDSAAKDHMRMLMEEKNSSNVEMQQKESMDTSKMDNKKMDSNQVDHSKMGHHSEKRKVGHSAMQGQSGSPMAMDGKSQEHAKSTVNAQMPKHALKQLSALPVSGVSREAGFDGRYTMESTSVLDDLSTQCARASRGLVMLDSTTWQKCAGKTGGLPKALSKDVKPMDHSMHNM